MAEELANTIEEVADVTSKITGREVGFFVAGAGLGVAVGFGVGYFVLNKRVEKKHWKEAEEEVARMREHYRKLRVAMEGEVQRRRPLEELVVEQGYAERYTPAEQEAIDKANEDNPPEEKAEEKVVNVFEQQETWDYSAERKNRSKDIPYIIHYDEFRENELEHEQSTITYYEEDDVLADERDIPVNDMDELIGLGNLGRWGHGSNDPNIVYIRNEHLEIDMEVIRDQRSYSEVVQGNIRHSSSDRMRRRHRRFDDE